MDPYRRYRPRNPYNGGRDLGLLAIFFLTFLLLGGVVAVLTVGTAWTLPELPQIGAQETRTSPLFGSSPLDKPNVFIGTPTPSGASSAPSVAGGGRTPTATTTTGRPSPTAQRSPTPTAGQPPTPQASPTATVTQGARLLIGNTGGVGAWLRRTPRINDYLIALVDGTPLEVVGPDVEAEGRAWKNVRDPQGNQGFVPAEWVVPAP